MNILRLISQLIGIKTLRLTIRTDRKFERTDRKFERNCTKNILINRKNSFEILGPITSVKEIVQRINRSIAKIPLKY